MTGDPSADAWPAIPKDAGFLAFPSSAMTATVGPAELGAVPFSRVVLAPAARISLPDSRVLNAPSVRHGVPGGWGYPGDPMLSWDAPAQNIFPRQVTYPEMAVSRLDDAYCLPYAPPFLPASRRLASDFNIPWDARAVGWFQHEADGLYRLPIELRLSEARRVETGFFLGHLVSGHFGHFMADCLSRIYAWTLCREIFGDVKLIIEHTREDTSFRDALLRAAGVDLDDVIFSQGLFRCRKLVLASPSLGTSQYASPTSARLWRRIRDAFGNVPAPHADKVYLSRSGQSARWMVNEAAVEEIFRKFGFLVVNLERYPIHEQVGIVSKARYVAGPGGSAMFNLAFQRRLRSVLLLIPETFVQITELLFLAGAECSVCFHVGSRDMPDGAPVTVNDSWRADLSRLAADIGAWLS